MGIVAPRAQFFLCDDMEIFLSQFYSIIIISTDILSGDINFN
jgi:hypothetical protein